MKKNIAGQKYKKSYVLTNFPAEKSLVEINWRMKVSIFSTLLIPNAFQSNPG